MADKTTTLKTKTNDNVYPNVIGDNRKNAFVDSSTITHHFYDQTHKVGFQIANETNIKIQNSLQKPTGLTKTKLVGVGTNGQENIEIGDNLTLANGKLSANGGSSGGEGGISVIELTDKNGTIASTQLSEINANPQNFAFKYNGKILLFTSSDSTTYQYCNNTTSSSDNNVMTTSTLLTITSSTGAYTIAVNVHNVVANSIHPANGGDLTNIQVGSKVYSIPIQAVYPLFVYCKDSKGYFSFTLPSLKPFKSTTGFFSSSIFTEQTGLTHLSVSAYGSWNGNQVLGFVYNTNKMNVYYWNTTDKKVSSDTMYDMDFEYRN